MTPPLHSSEWLAIGLALVLGLYVLDIWLTFRCLTVRDEQDKLKARLEALRPQKEMK